MGSTCVRGSANPSATTRVRLWAESAGHCSNPGCNSPLFVDVNAGLTAHFGEIAHIIAANDGGPRGDATVAVPDRGESENLVLLCANCHTIVDKAPETYSVEMLRAWKLQRMNTISTALGISAYATREEVRAAIEPLAAQNRYVHRAQGPDNDYRFNPLSEEAAVWDHQVVATIIPNHHSILRIIDVNRALLAEAEKDVVAEYRTHVAGLIHRHLGAGGLKVSRYPQEMERLYA